MTNNIVLTGNLAAPPELRFTQSGKAVLNARGADTPRRFNRDAQQWEDAGETLWADGTEWGEDAEAVAGQGGARRGRVAVTGQVGVRSFAGKDGQRVERITINANSFYLHPAKGATPRPSTPAADPWSTGGDNEAPF